MTKKLEQLETACSVFIPKRGPGGGSGRAGTAGVQVTAPAVSDRDRDLDPGVTQPQ